MLYNVVDGFREMEHSKTCSQERSKNQSVWDDAQMEKKNKMGN